MTPPPTEAAERLREFVKNSKFIHDGKEYCLMPELVADIRTVLDALPAWRAIETAPKDGTEVLTFRGAGLMAVAMYVSKDNIWKHEGWCVSDGCFHTEVTHWLPLPANPPPSTAKPQKCKRCDGDGYVDGREWESVTCGTCRGTGVAPAAPEGK